MQKILIGIMALLISFGLCVNEAAAKRFGGARSFGVQRSQSSLFSNNKSYNTANTASQGVNKQRWGGILGGLLVGGLLGSLFMGNGLASGLFSWIIVAGIALLIMGLLKRKSQPAWQNMQSSSNAFNQSPFNSMHQNPMGASQGSSSAQAQFDGEAFLRNAKLTFIRLQAAYDQNNLADIQEFTLPEVFAEIKMQLDERGSALNTTEVVSLNAELLDVSSQSFSTMASVRFTGSIKEEGQLSALNEIWHFRQLDNSKNWLLGGIQQDVYQP